MNNINNQIIAPCDLEIINIELNKVNDENELTITFLPLSQSIKIPCDGTIDKIKPFNFDYLIRLSDKKSTIQLILGEESQKSFGFGFDMKVAIGQPVNSANKMVNMDFEDLKNSILSYKSKLIYKTINHIDVKCKVGQRIKEETIIIGG